MPNSHVNDPKRWRDNRIGTLEMLTTSQTTERLSRLERLDDNQIPDSCTEIRLFAKMRNEALRLPHFLAYYTKLGIDRFFIVDNCSTDRTIEILRRNRNCHIFRTDQKMADARAGMDWIEPLLSEYGEDQWCLIVDADELLVYPNSESTPLAALCQSLDRMNANAMPCIMIDMYPEGSIEKVKYREGQSFIDASPFFDRGGYKLLESADVPMIIGGPRLRMFNPDVPDRRTAHVRRWIVGCITRIPILRRFLPKLRKLPILHRPKPHPPILNKVPLVRWNRDMTFTSAAHFVRGARIASARCALLHFKFLGDFNRRVNEEMARRAYFMNGAEYELYSMLIRRQTGIDFGCPFSTRYTGTQQLLELGLLKELAHTPVRLPKFPSCRLDEPAAGLSRHESVVGAETFAAH